MMKKAVCLLMLLVLLSGGAAADQAVQLPGGRYAIDLPDGMTYSAPAEKYGGSEAWFSADLEMDWISYSRAEAVEGGMPETLREAAESWSAGGMETELREVNGIEMLCYRFTDEADGAPCIGYVFADGEMMIEIMFWYATQDAADRIKAIMESIRETGTQVLENE